MAFKDWSAREFPVTQEHRWVHQWICSDCLDHVYDGLFEEASCGTGVGDCTRCHNCWRESTYDYSKPIGTNRWSGPELHYVHWPPSQPESVALALDAKKIFADLPCECSMEGLCNLHVPIRGWKVAIAGTGGPWLYMRNIKDLVDYVDDGNEDNFEVRPIMISDASLEALPEFDGF